MASRPEIFKRRAAAVTEKNMATVSGASSEGTMRPRRVIFYGFTAFLFSGLFGYFTGKRVADGWYAQHSSYRLVDCSTRKKLTENLNIACIGFLESDAFDQIVWLGMPQFYVGSPDCINNEGWAVEVPECDPCRDHTKMCLDSRKHKVLKAK